MAEAKDGFYIRDRDRGNAEVSPKESELVSAEEYEYPARKGDAAMTPQGTMLSRGFKGSKAHPRG